MISLLVNGWLGFQYSHHLSLVKSTQDTIGYISNLTMMQVSMLIHNLLGIATGLS